ncbi:MAG: glutamate 5-kinase [Elusimicrobia bacterium RIFCSPLOWO2_01_FULL_60_11]|nr:MAG: glutamate 5-kinase [Elusimicrobia bacterium RIFCSPLOWO2_01_FULL_60_11]
MKEKGADFIWVTSGAIGAGMKDLGWTKRPEDMKKKQAAAAVGQVSLMRTYQEMFRHHGVQVAQVLLSRDDFDDRRRYLNAQSTLSTLLEMGVVPVINENDTVSIEEIQFGDNDRLSALVAVKMHADLLVILSDVEGLYSSMSAREKILIPFVAKITRKIEKMAGKGSGSGLGTGGMASKVQAAKIAAAAGAAVVVAKGSRENVLQDILEGKSVGTRFASKKSLSARQRWIFSSSLLKSWKSAL